MLQSDKLPRIPTLQPSEWTNARPPYCSLLSYSGSFHPPLRPINTHPASAQVSPSRSQCSGSLTSGLCGVLGAVLGAVPHRLPTTPRHTKYLLSFSRYQTTFCTVHILYIRDIRDISISSKRQDILILSCSCTYRLTRPRWLNTVAIGPRGYLLLLPHTIDVLATTTTRISTKLSREF